LRGTDEAPQDNMLCRLYLDSYPAKWISEFKKIHGQDMSTINRSLVTAFMHERAIEASAADVRNKFKQTATTGKKESKFHKTKRTTKHTKKENNNSKTTGGHLQATDPCPIPGHDHPWGKCYNDINNPEAHKKRKERLSKSKSSDNHAMQDAASKEEDAKMHAQEVVDLLDNEPGFSDGKRNGYRYPAYSDLCPLEIPSESHHLDTFTTQQDLRMPTQPKLKSHGNSSTKSIHRS